MTRALVARVSAALVAAALAAGTVSCGGDAPPPAPPRRENVATWADVFDGTPDLYAVVRPRTLSRDGLYGGFWKALVRAAEARGFVRGATMLEAASGAEEIIIGLGRGADAALVLRGVPASLDPQKVVDAEGKPLFRPMNDRAKVVEYEPVDPALARAGALFVLPDRTWLGALGEARARARQAFATPMNRPAPKIGEGALAAVRVGGPLAHALDRHPTFGVLSKKLQSATFALEPGRAGLAVALAYEDQDAAAWAEMQAKRIALELSKDEPRLGWLKDAKVAYEGSTVLVRVAIPPRLLEELPSVSAADVGF